MPGQWSWPRARGRVRGVWSEQAIQDLRGQKAGGGEWGELSGDIHGEARLSMGLGTHPFRLTVPPSLFLVMIGFPVTLASCSHKRRQKDQGSPCNSASPNITYHHPPSPSIAQHHPASPGVTSFAPASLRTAEHCPARPQPGAQAADPDPRHHQTLTMFSRKAGTRVALGSTTKASAELKRAPCRASGRQESRGCRRAERRSSMGWSG